MDGPRVTVGVPVFNGAECIRRALDSVLAQTFTDFVVEISDNASTDSTGEICSEYVKRDTRVRYIRQPSNIGAARNFNFLAARARSRYFMWHCVDDFTDPSYLEVCFRTLEARPDAVLAYTRAGSIDANGTQTMPPADAAAPYDERDCISRFRFCLKPMAYDEDILFGLMRTSALQATRLQGAFPGGDRAFCAEMSLRGAYVRLPEVLFWRRTYQDRMSAEERWIYDAAGRRGPAMKEWRILLHHCGTLTRAALPGTVKVRLWRELAQRAFADRRQLLRELLIASSWALGRR